MPIQRSRVETRLRPWLQTRLNPDIVDMLVEEDFVEMYNDVARDMNNIGALNIERFHQTLDSDIAEDSDVTNVLMAGIIERVIDFRYPDSDWRDVLYGYVDDRIMFKETANGIKVDIYYLRRPEDVDITTDEIDLPEEVLPEFVEVMKIKILSDYGENVSTSYEDAVEFYSYKSSRKLKKNFMGDTGLRRDWFDQTGDDHTYVITHQYVSLDNFVVDSNGNYQYIGE